VDLHFLRGHRDAELTQDEAKRKRAAEMEALELGLGSTSDAVVVVSTEERRLLKEKLPGRRIALISMIHDVQSEIPPYSSRRDCLFVGGFEHTPNVDAMIWFCSEIMPRVLEELPETKLHIIGSKIPESIRLLASEHIITHGYVERLEPFLESCVLSVAPLRYGAGVKGKITQSMSWGLPVVSTSIGAEGMHLEHEKNVLVADKAAVFARHIVHLHRDPELWQRLSQNGLRTIEEHFSMAAAKRNTQELLLQLQVLPSLSAATPFSG
jgi:O-antigen biosynthesis protein